MTDFALTLRRARIHPALRDMLADVSLSAADFIYPVFVSEGGKPREPIASMPGICRHTPDTLLEDLQGLAAQGLRAVMLFGVIDDARKDDSGSYALGEDSIVARAVRDLKRAIPSLLVAVDLCFCEYTSHGHCGMPDAAVSVANAPTVRRLGEQALALARAGADLIAPSGMMDGAVGGIRAALNAAGFDHLPIMAYSVKYASSFYGPFRDAAASTLGQGNRARYQQDFRRDAREAIEEARRDIEEGADIVMVKPGLPYLDILAALRARFNAPLAAYHVSGEYAMLRAAGDKGWIDYDAVLWESMCALKRAGASIILSYATPDLLRILAGRRTDAS